VIPYKRSETFSTTDLMANSGGLFGLFVGVSLMCCLKVIYDCMLRLQWHPNYQKKDDSSPIPMSSMSQSPDLMEK
jgi:Amiloride-sensitive sodium channel